MNVQLKSMLLQELKTFIAKKNLLQKSDKILVAVSGGKDSMALLHLLKEAGYYVEVAHFNFKLRGEDSELDQQLVQKYCNVNAIVCHSTSADCYAEAKRKGISIQVAARELRYAFFNKTLKERGLNKLTTAHHLNDNIETLLYGFAKGLGPKGLAGIPLQNGTIVRPLLFASSAQIQQYLVEQNLVWREDISNAENKYQRNKIRNKIIPLLKEINPGFEHTAGVNIERFNALNDIFSERFNNFKTKILVKDGAYYIPEMLYKEYPGGVLLLEEFLKPMGFNYPEIIQLSTITHPGKYVETASHLAAFHDAHLVVSRKKVIDNESISFPGPGVYELKQGRISIQVIPNEGQDLDFSNPNSVFFDENKIFFPLFFRPWLEGDTFKPFGMKTFKRVSNYLSDNKIPKHEKNNQMILSDSEKIIWILGKRTDERARISPEATHILNITFDII